MPGITHDQAAAGYDAIRGCAPGIAERIRDHLLLATGGTAPGRALAGQFLPAAGCRGAIPGSLHHRTRNVMARSTRSAAGASRDG